MRQKARTRRTALFARLWRGAALPCLLLLAPAACGDDAPPEPPPEPSCGISYLGERGADIEITLTALGADSTSTPLADGDPIGITTPPQGGRVVFVGVRARNMDACGAQLKGILRDPESKRVMLDSRTINLRLAPDGWGTSVDSDISTFANISACPNLWSPRDVFDQDYQLEVQLTERRGRTATKTVTVRPTCSEPDAAAAAECRCICKPVGDAGAACD